MAVVAPPLVPRWTLVSLAPCRAGRTAAARVQLENAGSATWRSTADGGLRLSYHWLDPSGNAIVWDGPRTVFSNPVAPGDTIELAVDVVVPRAPGRLRLCFDLVEEFHFWCSEIGADVLEHDTEILPGIEARRLAVVVYGGESAATSTALARLEEPLVTEAPCAVAHLVAGCEPDPGWSRVMLDAHEEGWLAVGPGIVPLGSRAARQRLEPWAPGGRNPRFGHALLLPSLAAGLEAGEVDGLPAYEGEGLFEGGATIRLAG
ncbi:MAG: hypothetical protein U0R50_07470 [Gaiellales bacterium]